MCAGNDENVMDAATASEQIQTVVDEVESVVIAQEGLLETILTAVVADGHVLLEDVPGTGKTLTAQTIATALNLEFNRIQFTPDLLPSDITGTEVFNKQAGTFEFREGPLFANVVLADEINRAPPKTQAALLEAMSEEQVSVGNITYDLPEPFIVIATQNPVEQEGTFELPEAQRDRFMVKTEMGYPDRDGEIELLMRRGNRQTSEPTAEPVTNIDTVRTLQVVPETVRTTTALDGYIVDICRATRDHDDVAAGVSPRGIQRLFEASRTRAVFAGRDYVVPDDVHSVLMQCLAHRLVLTTEASVTGTSKERLVEVARDSVTVPSMDEIQP